MSAVLAAASDSAPAAALRWSNRFVDLGPTFFTRVSAQPLPDPHWVARSPACAELLGLPGDWWQSPGFDALQVLSGNATLAGMEPLASVYGGHQFGVWTGQLGDGRALWLGEVETPSGPMEMQLKGAGRTPYSRMGDGRAVLRSSIREFLGSEAMHALGVPTTRALCIIGSPLPVRREEIETAAILTRVAPSFIRFGHFEHFAARGQIAELRRIADFVIRHYYPECREASQPYAALLAAVGARTAGLMAQWQALGFCHGVMNTDNLSILGLTIDYGPFGFLDACDPAHVCNHSDHEGRYAWARQPNVALWNLHALGQALLPLIGDPDAAVDAIDTYRCDFPPALAARLAAKLGLVTAEEGDRQLADDLLQLMATQGADFTITFRRLAGFDESPGAANAPLRDLFHDRPAFDGWAARYAERLRREPGTRVERRARMDRVNPKFILRNHLAEIAIRAAQAGDFGEAERLRAVLDRPFDEQPEASAYADFPPEWAQSIEVSCSS
jgi:uncharacterized protein YdiU (UPF0061 family)